MNGSGAARLDLGESFFFNGRNNDVVSLRARSIQHEEGELAIAGDETKFHSQWSVVSGRWPVFNGAICPGSSSIHLVSDPLRPLAREASPMFCGLNTLVARIAGFAFPFPAGIRAHVPEIGGTLRWSAVLDLLQCCSE